MHTRSERRAKKALKKKVSIKLHGHVKFADYLASCSCWGCQKQSRKPELKAPSIWSVVDGE